MFIVTLKWLKKRKIYKGKMDKGNMVHPGYYVGGGSFSTFGNLEKKMMTNMMTQIITNNK